MCFEGDSGLTKIIPPEFVTKYNTQLSQIELINGSLIQGITAEKPDRARGPQYHMVWCDELATWVRLQATWDNIMMGLRLGVSPKCIITTTPRPIPLLKKLRKRKDVKVIRGATHDNFDNLAPSFKKVILEQYDGTRLGRQELYGELLEDVVGALWVLSNIARNRIQESEVPPIRRYVVAIDPATTSNKDSDETGIVVVGLGEDGKYYVLEDVTDKYTPAKWAKASLAAYHRWSADYIVAEVNQGGDMVKHTIHTEEPAVMVKTIHAKKGKQARAEPISALYEQNKVIHVGELKKLEDQMCSWVPSETSESPDRVDALVYAISQLAFKNQTTPFFGYL